MYVVGEMPEDVPKMRSSLWIGACLIVVSMSGRSGLSVSDSLSDSDPASSLLSEYLSYWWISGCSSPM